jgi:hypothetical protein
LLKNGAYYNGSEELFYDDFLYKRNPRSGVCKISKNKIAFIVVDGRSEIS